MSVALYDLHTTDYFVVSFRRKSRQSVSQLYACSFGNYLQILHNVNLRPNPSGRTYQSNLCIEQCVCSVSLWTQ